MPVPDDRIGDQASAGGPSAEPGGTTLRILTPQFGQRRCRLIDPQAPYAHVLNVVGEQEEVFSFLDQARKLLPIVALDLDALPLDQAIGIGRVGWPGSQEKTIGLQVRLSALHVRETVR